MGGGKFQHAAMLINGHDIDGESRDVGVEIKYIEGVHQIYLLAGGGIRGLQCQATQQGTEACTSTNAACIIDIIACCCHPRRYGRWSCIGCCGVWVGHRRQAGEHLVL